MIRYLIIIDGGQVMMACSDSLWWFTMIVNGVERRLTMLSDD